MESIAKTELETQLLTLCSDVMEARGYRIVDLDCRVGGRSMLRVFIEPLVSKDATAARPGVALEDCVEASRTLGPILEEFPGIPGMFDLEVSSPGLDRRLRLRSDFDAIRGQEVHLKLEQRIEGVGGQLKGTILATDSQNVLVSWSGKELSVPWRQIKQANQIWKVE
ncbi:hypothetical protein K2X33_04895 [bacterium]|nr:hypothetical protein [bacterium]